MSRDILDDRTLVRGSVVRGLRGPGGLPLVGARDLEVASPPPLHFQFARRPTQHGRGHGHQQRTQPGCAVRGLPLHAGTVAHL